jgi:hypothetical protein
MAPELKRGDPTEHSDQHALAATYAWVRLGHPLFPVPKGDMQLDLVPQEEQRVLMRALAPEASGRFPTCSQFAEALLHAIRANLDTTT